MGIPQLIATLEPYATHTVLQDANVVIDGPGLAHHILHVCRVNGFDQPSYKQLGLAVISWLDKLASQNVVVQQLYFDGFLPSSKRPVRMSRTLKSASQIYMFCNVNTGGCPREHISPLDSIPVDAFMTGKTDKKPFAAPSFLVPAVIDAVRSSSKYGSLVRMVPGEADGFCARHAASSGATVLTSDSDLLVHDLGTGRVALLRDIYRGEDAVIRCSLYTPSEIFPKLGLPSPSDVHRFAYERWRTTHATVSSLVRACEDPVTDAGEYKEFRAQYLSEDEEDGAIPSLGEHLSIQHLDPRFSEVLLQLCQPELSTSGDADARMFLPILIENPDRGTAWEQSTPIRRLAYSVARRLLPGHTTTIQEYRRVQTLDQKGRQVSVLSTKDMLASVEELVQVMSHLKKTTKAKSIPFWPMLYLVLDARECFAQGKDSHVLSTVLQRHRSLWPRENFQRVHWDFMHFVAQLQAAYYSLRMLWQVLHLSTSSAQAILGSHYPTLLEILNGLPELPESPGVESITQFLRTAPPKVVRETLAEFVDVGEDEPQNTERRSKRHKKDSERNGQSGKKVAQTGASKQNMFDMLAME